MILDATAGNRSMWRHRKYDPKGVVFLDKELGLKRPPHVFGDARSCPFREAVFDCVIFDPPHKFNCTAPSDWNNPQHFRWRGINISRGGLLNLLNYAPIEFLRVLKERGRLCLKWSEHAISLWKILVFFKEFKEVYRKKISTNYRGDNTYWITFVRCLV